MTFATPGNDNLAAEVTNVSAHGFWILLRDEELFLPFSTFPWFRKAAIGELTKVELRSERHLYWSNLDIDLSIDSIRRPEALPLVSRVGA